MIKGIPVILYEQTLTGENDLGEPVYQELPVTIQDVLVAPSSTEDITNNQTLYGKHSVYTLCIPKGDSHKWEDSKVEFFGQTFKTFGSALYGIEENIPLRWNGKIQVERYGG